MYCCSIYNTYYIEYLERHFIEKKKSDWIQRPGLIEAFVIPSFILAQDSSALLLYLFECDDKSSQTKSLF